MSLIIWDLFNIRILHRLWKLLSSSSSSSSSSPLKLLSYLFLDRNWRKQEIRYGEIIGVRVVRNFRFAEQPFSNDF